MRLQPAEFKILQHLRDTRLFSKPGSVIHLMLSGGKDSVALLEVLHNIERLPSIWSGVSYSLVLHHFNHKRRGAASELDEQLCTDLARRLGCPIVTHRWTEELEKRLTEGVNFQAIARDWRYQEVRKFAENHHPHLEKGFWAIATAHHRRDHAETVLHNLVRGCGPDGLRGMSPWSEGTRLLRPFLWMASEVLDQYIAEKSFEHREDSSNQSLDYTRNRLRHGVLKELEQLNPKVIEHFWLVSQDLRQEPKNTHSLEKNSAEREHRELQTQINLDKLTGISELRSFLLARAPELSACLTREKLINILSHMRKLAAKPSTAEGYKIALSDKVSVTINSKQLEVKVTS